MLPDHKSPPRCTEAAPSSHRRTMHRTHCCAYLPIARGLKLYGTDRALPRRRAHECTSRQCWRHCCHATACATTGTGATAAAGAPPPVSACTSRGVVGSQPVSWIGHVSCRMAHGAMQCLWKTQPHEPNASEHGVPLTMPSQRAMHSMPGWKSMGQGREQHMVGEERRTSRMSKDGSDKHTRLGCAHIS